MTIQNPENIWALMPKSNIRQSKKMMVRGSTSKRISNIKKYSAIFELLIKFLFVFFVSSCYMHQSWIIIWLWATNGEKHEQFELIRFALTSICHSNWNSNTRSKYLPKFALIVFMFVILCELNWGKMMKNLGVHWVKGTYTKIPWSFWLSKLVHLCLTIL